MNQTQRVLRMLKVFAVYFGGMTLLSLGPMLVGEVLGPRSYVVTAPLLVIGIIGLSIFCFWWLNRLEHPQEYQEAREAGLLTTAKVLEIRKTGWRKVKRRGFPFAAWKRDGFALSTLLLGMLAGNSRRIVGYEHQMRLLVSHPEMSPYEATLAAYLASNEVPKKGATIQVNVHRQRPEIVVLAETAHSPE